MHAKKNKEVYLNKLKERRADRSLKLRSSSRSSMGSSAGDVNTPRQNRVNTPVIEVPESYRDFIESGEHMIYANKSIPHMQKVAGGV